VSVEVQTTAMIRVVLQPSAGRWAHVRGEVKLDVEGQATQRAVLDTLEAAYPMLRGRSATRSRSSAERS